MPASPERIVSDVVQKGVEDVLYDLLDDFHSKRPSWLLSS